MKRELVKRVVANVIDFDMHNLFPPRTWGEELEESETDSYETQPRRTLRERQYGPMPLIVKPKYKGDFLERLKERALPREAASPYNIYDYSMPSELLKHIEEPIPDDRTHGYIERNRPGPGAGMDTIRDWYDRGWDPTDSPEMSEDKWLRMKESPKGRPWSPALNKPQYRNVPEEMLDSAKRIAGSFMQRQSGISGPDPAVVIASHLMTLFPVELVLDLRRSKLAIMLEDLFESQYFSDKRHGYRSVSTSGVTAYMTKADPRRGLWIFKVQPQTPTGPQKSLPAPYTVIFEAIPRGNVRDVKKLHVRCSCTCPSWLWYGAQYNAFMNDYLYPPLRPKFLPPRRRDPQKKFLCCKHVIACLSLMVGQKIEVPKSRRERVRRMVKPKMRLEKVPEEVKIPEDLRHFEEEPEMKTLIDRWDRMSYAGRRRAINRMDDPDRLSFMAHRFPETATLVVADRLKRLIKTSKDEEVRDKSEEILEEIG